MGGTDTFGVDSLSFACDCSAKDVALLVLDHAHIRGNDAPGAATLPDDVYAATALHHACAAGMLPVVKRLTAAGVGAGGTGDNSPLFQAARNGHVDVVLALLAAGADPWARAASGEDALLRAIHSEGNTTPALAILDAAALLAGRRPHSRPSPPQ